MVRSDYFVPYFLLRILTTKPDIINEEDDFL
jgi:hypothetical protein